MGGMSSYWRQSLTEPAENTEKSNSSVRDISFKQVTNAKR